MGWPGDRYLLVKIVYGPNSFIKVPILQLHIVVKYTRLLGGSVILLYHVSSSALMEEAEALTLPKPPPLSRGPAAVSCSFSLC